MSLGHDLSLTMVPPPDGGPILAFGRAMAPFGQTFRYGAEMAMAEFNMRYGSQRTDPAVSSLKASVKSVVKKSPLMRQFLGFKPSRTAEALVQLAALEPELSSPALRAELRDRMLERLAAVSAATARV